MVTYMFGQILLGLMLDLLLVLRVQLVQLECLVIKAQSAQLVHKVQRAQLETKVFPVHKEIWDHKEIQGLLAQGEVDGLQDQLIRCQLYPICKMVIFILKLVTTLHGNMRLVSKHGTYYLI